MLVASDLRDSTLQELKELAKNGETLQVGQRQRTERNYLLALGLIEERQVNEMRILTVTNEGQALLRSEEDA